ncbi:MAG: hypothetical protein JNM89_02215 [Hyphomicrobiaceae bacterium]|nr:hypothetical protein [Hyphomicrobiaceae bacterium]
MCHPPRQYRRPHKTRRFRAGTTNGRHFAASELEQLICDAKERTAARDAEEAERAAARAKREAEKAAAKAARDAARAARFAKLASMTDAEREEALKAKRTLYNRTYYRRRVAGEIPGRDPEADRLRHNERMKIYMREYRTRQK